MVETNPGSAREEAERLVAAGLAALRLAGLGAGRDGGRGPLGDLLSAALGHQSGWATGSAECTVCPICRTIAALRDPRPEVAEQLAAGAGDLAAGVASLLRALANVAGGARERQRPTRDEEPARDAQRPARDGQPTGSAPQERAAAADPVWRAHTRSGHDLWPAAEPDVWSMATRTDRSGTGVDTEAVRVDTPRTHPTSGSAAEPGGVPATRHPMEPPVTGDDQR